MLPEQQSPSERVCALDYGLARIGVAIEDELGLLAHPRPFVPARPENVALASLLTFFKEERVTKLLVGLPRNMDGTLGPSARGAEKFGLKLAERAGLPIEFVDERLSTVQAYALLRESGRDAKKAKAHVDSASACILLQSHLDARKSR